MNSFIVISKNASTQEEYLKNFITERKISPFDSTRLSEEASIGIEIVRKLQATIFLKPYKGDSKIIIIENAQNLTIEAQNALLKLLEEPPIHAYIFLCATTADVFLPTILSRCTLIHLEEKIKSQLSGEQCDKYTNIVACLQSGSIGEKLALAETAAADKENLEKWFETITNFVREKMLEEIDNKEASFSYARILHCLQEAYKTVSTTNVSPRTILEHCFLSIPMSS